MCFINIIFLIALRLNLITICKIIINHNPEISNNETYFYNSCNYGFLDIAKYLYSKNNEKYVFIDFEELFINSCKNGKIKVSIWLLSINNNLNNKTFLENALIETCFHTQLNISDYLLQINPDLDISVNNNIILKNACIYGNIKVVKWLFNINNNIDLISIHNCIYLGNCNNNIVNIVHWLSENNCKYKISIYNKIIKCKIKITDGFQFINNVDNIELCCICMEKNCNIITNCDHQFCLDCIVHWLNKDKSCPTCRKNNKLNFYEIIHL